LGSQPITRLWRRLNFDEISFDTLVFDHHDLHDLRDLFFEVLDNYDHMKEEYNLQKPLQKDEKAKKVIVQAQQPPNSEPQSFKNSLKPAQRKSTRKHTLYKSKASTG
ncbi:hypothetical protein FRC03_006780, partial [Tulasnella sp. 419]